MDLVELLTSVDLVDLVADMDLVDMVDLVVLVDMVDLVPVMDLVDLVASVDTAGSHYLPSFSPCRRMSANSMLRHYLALIQIPSNFTTSGTLFVTYFCPWQLPFNKSCLTPLLLPSAILFLGLMLRHHGDPLPLPPPPTHTHNTLLASLM